MGLGFIFVLIPVQNWMAEQIGVVRRKMVKLTDERVKLINEFLHAIRVVMIFCTYRYINVYTYTCIHTNKHK